MHYGFLLIPLALLSFFFFIPIPLLLVHVFSPPPKKPTGIGWKTSVWLTNLKDMNITVVQLIMNCFRFVYTQFLSKPLTSLYLLLVMLLGVMMCYYSTVMLDIFVYIQRCMLTDFYFYTVEIFLVVRLVFKRLLVCITGVFCSLKIFSHPFFILLKTVKRLQ